MFWKPAPFPFSSKQAPNLVTPYIKLFSVTGYHGNINLLRYAPENRSYPRLITGKWQLKNSKLTTRLKIKSG
jgi:hypothetical protein